MSEQIRTTEHPHIFTIHAHEIQSALDGSTSMLYDYVLDDVPVLEGDIDFERELNDAYNISSNELTELISVTIPNAVSMMNTHYSGCLIGKSGDDVSQMINSDSPYDVLASELMDSFWNYIIDQTLNEVMFTVEPNWIEFRFEEARLMYGGNLAILTTVRCRVE